jgi:hypothetical protein
VLSPISAALRAALIKAIRQAWALGHHLLIKQILYRGGIIAELRVFTETCQK